MSIYDFAKAGEKTKTVGDRILAQGNAFASVTGWSTGKALAHMEDVYRPTYLNAFELAGYSNEDSRKFMGYCDQNGIPYDAMLNSLTGPVILKHPTPLETLRKEHMKELRRERMQYIGWKLYGWTCALISLVLYALKIAVIIPVMIDRATDWMLRKIWR